MIFVPVYYLTTDYRMNSDAKEQAQMHSRREWGRSKTKTLQASLIDFSFFLPIPAGWDHPCQSGKSVVDFLQRRAQRKTSA